MISTLLENNHVVFVVFTHIYESKQNKMYTIAWFCKHDHLHKDQMEPGSGWITENENTKKKKKNK